MYRLVRIGVAAIAALVLAACGGTSSGSATNTALSATTSSAADVSSAGLVVPSSSSSNSTGSSVDSGSSLASSGATPEVDPVAVELSSRLIAALGQVTSLHLEATSQTGPLQTAFSGDQTLSEGTLRAARMTSTGGGIGQTELVVADGKLYVSGPLATQYGQGKQWIEVGENSENADVKQIYALLEPALTSSGPEQYIQFLKLATNTHQVGSESIDGRQADKYTYVLDYTRLDSADLDPMYKAGLQALIAQGTTSADCTYWLDAANGRPLKFEFNSTLAGQPYVQSLMLSKFNEPVDIAAPDPATVATP